MSNREVAMTWALRLYEAVEKVDADAVKVLVHEKGANSDIILPKYGISAFHLAVGIEPTSFSKEVTTMFLVSGGNPNVRSSEDLTPVHVASIWGRAENLELLLLAGGDPRALDNEGCTPLHYAQEKNNFPCIDIIQKFMRADGHCSPAFGPLRILGSGIEPWKIEYLKGLITRKNVSKQGKHLDFLNCRHSSNACKNEHKNLDGCSTWQETKGRVMPNITVEDNDLISEDNMSQDSVQIIEDVGNLLQGDNENGGPFSAPDETYLIHSSPEVSHLQSHYTVDCMTHSESALGTASKDHIDDNSVRNTTQIISVHDRQYNCWSNSYLTNDASNKSDYNCETRASATNLSYVNFLLNVESTKSSTPLQRRESKLPRSWCEENCVLPQEKTYDINSENSSILSISCPEIYQKCFEEEFKNITSRQKMPYVSHKNSKVFNISMSESEDYFTVPEEVYEITDDEEQIILEEKRLETPILSGKLVHRRTEEEFPWEGHICMTSSSSSLTSCCTEDIRRELYKVVSCGCRCPLGPITATTKRVYLKMIKKFKVANPHLMDSEPLLPPTMSDSKFSRELEETLVKPSKLSHGKYFELDQKMMMQFDGNGKFSQWRDGNQKSSFNYLLLDPRMTLNLPLRWANDGSLDKSFYSNRSSQYWREFLSSIFYVGKGKRSRPYSHLYEAVAAWRSNCSDLSKLKKKVKHIIGIWKENLGVVCVHIFQNVIPAEALTREAAMIDALGLNNLTNEQRGKYYGLISSLGFSEKRYFGSFLLHRALIIFLSEGERQIKPADLG